MGLYALSSAWLFTLIAPLVLFYFLKLKRPRLEIPSLVLWRQVLNDRRVNSPLQRFKRNLLLLLQLVLLVLLVLAAMQPFWRGGRLRAQRIPVIIDCSASMGAVDKPGGATRLQVATKELGGMIDSLAPDQEMCLITFGRAARKQTDFTNDKRALREALRQIQVEDVPSDPSTVPGGHIADPQGVPRYGAVNLSSGIEDALRVAQALARSDPFEEVVMFSDGNFPSRAYFDLSFGLDYQRLAPAGPNVGITSLNARRRLPAGGQAGTEGGWDVFALIEGSADAEGPVTVEISREGGDVVGMEHVSITKGTAHRMVFRASGDSASSLKVTLIPEGFDSLACDNVAFLELPLSRPLRTYVSADLDGYRRVLEVLEGVSVESGGEGSAGLPASGGPPYDLVITNREEDLALEGTTCCYVGLVPEDLRELVSVEEGGARVVDWSRSSPLLQHVELNDVVIADQPRSGQDVGESDYEGRGYEVLIHGESGPLLLQKRDRAKLLFNFLFHSDHSTLPYRVGFPVLVSNLVQVAREQAGLAEAHGRRTGILSGVLVQPERTCEIRGPEGETRVERSDEAGVLSGVPAPRVGYYDISEGGKLQSRIGASLLAASETKLERVEEIKFAEDLSVAASSVAPETDRPLWSVLAIVAFCVLLGEWWYFNRDPRGTLK